VKYNIGDVVKIVDAPDYNGDSLSYYDGLAFEIKNIALEGGIFCYKLNGFYRSVTEKEIEKLIFSCSEKFEKFNKEFSLVGNPIFYFSANKVVQDIVKYIVFTKDLEPVPIVTKDYMGTGSPDPFKYYTDELSALKALCFNMRNTISTLKSKIEGLSRLV